LTEVGVESSKTVPVSATTKPSWTCKSFTASNYAHVQDGRAYNDGGMLSYHFFFSICKVIFPFNRLCLC